jgi:hypothetical protein
MCVTQRDRAEIGPTRLGLGRSEQTTLCGGLVATPMRSWSLCFLLLHSLLASLCLCPRCSIALLGRVCRGDCVRRTWPGRQPAGRPASMRVRTRVTIASITAARDPSLASSRWPVSRCVGREAAGSASSSERRHAAAPGLCHHGLTACRDTLRRTLHGLTAEECADIRNGSSGDNCAGESWRGSEELPEAPSFVCS